MIKQTVVIGRLVSNPVRRGNSCHFILANTVFNDGKEEVIKHSIKAINRQAQICMEYLHKGELCCIEGNVVTENEQNTIIPSRIVFLTPDKKH